MKEYKYKVSLDTSFGKKSGIMLFDIEGEDVNGILKIMQHENLFHGHILNEKCHITGNLKTLIHTFHYEADGTVTVNEISFVLVTNKHRFILTGGAEIE